jgi:hypothetical protein
MMVAQSVEPFLGFGERTKEQAPAGDRSFFRVPQEAREN